MGNPRRSRDDARLASTTDVGTLTFGVSEPNGRVTDDVGAIGLGAFVSPQFLEPIQDRH